MTASERTQQPGTSEGPVALDGSHGDVELLRSLGSREPAEEEQLHDTCTARVGAIEIGERAIEVEELGPGGFLWRRLSHFVELQVGLAVAAFRRCPRPSVVHEDAAHGLGDAGEEVGAVLPARAVVPLEPGIRLMNECGRAQAVPWAFASKMARCQSTELVVDDRQHFVERGAVAARCPVQDLGDLASRGLAPQR